MKLLLSPHDDDHALFAAFTCLREKPVVCVVTDSHIQPKRGNVGCGAKERAAETDAANRVLGCSTVRLGIPDDAEDAEQKIFAAIHRLCRPTFTVVYAPAVQGGNAHHDMVGRAAVKIFGKKVVQYTTYTKTELYTAGSLEVAPTPEELELKAQALACYESQWLINKLHFEAVLGRSEWLEEVS